MLMGGGLAGVSEGETIQGWFVTAFFGLCLAVALVMMLPGAGYLRLQPEGFEICSLFRRTHVRWLDVQSFKVARVGPNRMVVFNFAQDHSPGRTGRRIARGLSGWEGGVPHTFGMAPEALADLMNDYRKRARDARPRQ